MAAEQERQRMYEERMEAERLAELDRRVERERVEAEIEELEGQRTQETLKAIRDEAVLVEAARIARGYGTRLAEEDGTLAAKVRTFILDQAADSVTIVRRHASWRLPRDEPVRARGAFRDRVAARRSVEWLPAWQFVSLFLCQRTCRRECSPCMS